MQILAETITAAQWEGVVIGPTMINWIRLGLGPLDTGVYGQLQFFVYFSLSTVMQLLLKYIQSLFYYKIKIAGLLSVFKKQIQPDCFDILCFAIVLISWRHTVTPSLTQKHPFK